jgi:hypothetical protein
VRGDHGQVAQVLLQSGGKVVGKDGELTELADSPLAGNVRLFAGYDPEWEIDPRSLHIDPKPIGEGEFGVVCRAVWNGTQVAVKILKESPMAVGDFRSELNVLQKVHHPHTVRSIHPPPPLFPSPSPAAPDAFPAPPVSNHP